MSTVAEWMQRPRPRFLDALPASRFLQAMLALPIVCLCITIAWLTGGPRPESHVLLLIFSGVAVLEMAFAMVWLCRPKESREAARRRRMGLTPTEDQHAGADRLPSDP